MTDRYPMNVDTTGWGAFGTFDRDHLIERERKAFTRYTLERHRKGASKGVDWHDIYCAGVLATVQILFAQADNLPTEADRQKMHEMFDWAWLMVESMARDFTEGSAS